LLPFEKGVNRDQHERNSPLRPAIADARVRLSDLLLQQRFKRFLPDFGFRRRQGSGTAEEVLRGLAVPFQAVECRAHAIHEVGAAYLSCAGKSIFEFLADDPLEFHDPLFEVRWRYGLQTTPRRLTRLHGNRRTTRKQWHTAWRPDVAEVVRRPFLVLLSEMDAHQRIALPLRAEQLVGQFRREIEVEVRDLILEFDAARFALVRG